MPSPNGVSVTDLSAEIKMAASFRIDSDVCLSCEEEQVEIQKDSKVNTSIAAMGSLNVV